MRWGSPRGWLLFHARLATNALTTISFLFPTGPVLLSPLLICGLSVHIKNIVSNEARSVLRQDGSTGGKRGRELFLLEASTTQPTSPPWPGTPLSGFCACRTVVGKDTSHKAGGGDRLDSGCSLAHLLVQCKSCHSGDSLPDLPPWPHLPDLLLVTSIRPMTWPEVRSCLVCANRVSWDISGCVKVFWCVPGYSGVFRSVLECPRVSLLVQECSGVFQSIQRCPGSFLGCPWGSWYITVFLGCPRRFWGFSVVFQDVLGYPGHGWC